MFAPAPTRLPELAGERDRPNTVRSKCFGKPPCASNSHAPRLELERADVPGRRHHEWIRERSVESVEPVLTDDTIVVGEGDEVGLGLDDAAVPCPRLSGLRLEHIPDGVLLAELLRAVVGRGVVDDDDLGRPRAQRREALEAASQLVGAIARADDDRDAGLRPGPGSGPRQPSRMRSRSSQTP